jgi:hypothetical protein
LFEVIDERVEVEKSNGYIEKRLNSFNSDYKMMLFGLYCYIIHM